MRDFIEYDFDNPAHRQRRRPHVVEILPPRQPDREQRVHVDVTIHHRRDNHAWLWLALPIVLLVLICFRPLPLLVLAVLVPGTLWLTILAMVAVVAIVAFRERVAGRPF